MLIITLGDPLSINIELVLKEQSLLRVLSKPVLLIGSGWHWQYQSERLQQFGHLTAQEWTDDEIADKENMIYFCDVGAALQPASTLTPQERGTIATKSLQKASEIIKKTKQKTAIVTSPIDKHACQQAGFQFPGHTEFFSQLVQRETAMLLAGPQIKVALATNHLPLNKVAEALSQPLIEQKLSLLSHGLQKYFHIKAPRIAVCGLNPHASDHGMFGNEEQTIIRPAIAAFQKQNPNLQIVGPVPADTIFYRALRGQFDGVLAMYHDQGLGPLKTVHFDDAVNITLGLPFFRVSPDHGPAADIFLKGIASSQSFATAIQLAKNYLEHV